MNESEVKNIELSEVDEQIQPNVQLSHKDFELVKNVSMEVEVCIGKSDIKVEKLFALKAGEILALDREVDQPVELKIDNRVVAVGNLVAVDGYFGIEIVQVKEG